MISLAKWRVIALFHSHQFAHTHTVDRVVLGTIHENEQIKVVISSKVSSFVRERLRYTHTPWPCTTPRCGDVATTTTMTIHHSFRAAHQHQCSIITFSRFAPISRWPIWVYLFGMIAAPSCALHVVPSTCTHRSTHTDTHTHTWTGRQRHFGFTKIIIYL